ncbi:flagellar filament capping protein FliD [Pantoea sp. BRR-3P]|uniref:flagellar filament capping protein FliD n=1 Tax=Pantoea sp. BRR-3P TaxID=3141541 RepID=UPI0031F58013
MAIAPISGLGGSGLDIQQLLGQLEAAESKKLNPYLQKQNSYSGQLSAWSKISSSLDALKTNLGKLQDEGFNGVSIGDNKAFKATAGKGAIPNSYSVAVAQLAKSHKIGSAAQDTNDAQLGNGSDTRTLKITVGEGQPMEVTLKNDETSLVQIAKKINAQNGDVNATVMAAEGGKFKLVVTSKKTGSEGEIKMEVSGDDTLAGVLDYGPGKTSGMEEMTKALNAKMYIDGELVERSSNTITDAIEGITFELREVSEITKDEGDIEKNEYKPETLAVTADTSKVKSMIEEFVKQYNAFLSTASSVSVYKEPIKNADELAQQNPNNGALFGDGTLRRLSSQIKSAAVGSYSDISKVFPSLGSLGISVKFDEFKAGQESTGTMGMLTIDSKKLEEALKNNPKEVEALFLGKDGAEGLKGKMDGLFKTYLGDNEGYPKVEGAIATAKKGIEAQDKRNEKQISRIEDLIKQSLARSQKEFIRLDKAMTEMNNMSTQLQSALLGMMNS